MEINRNNCQVWITDYYDGLLSEEESNALHRFLDLNPDLKEEFNSLEDFILYPDISIRMDKESLRKELADEDKDAIEHCALALSENDLDAKTEIEFRELTERSGKARSEYDIYSSLKLAPGKATYPYKAALKRIPYRLSFTRTAIRIFAVAASLALIISLALLLPGETENYYSYNTAYLVPFNNDQQTLEEGGIEYKPVLNAGTILPKDINIRARPAETGREELTAERDDLSLDKSPFRENVSLALSREPVVLMAMSNASPSASSTMEENLSPRQFLAMNFRKHLLKEDVDNTDRLKAYELADVSIDGLNKLLGWEMQFEKEKTEDGRLASFKFTSQLLNLDHKVKKVDD